MFEKIAIVGVGEFAARAGRTCDRMTIPTITLYDASQSAPHYVAAEQAIAVAGLLELSEEGLRAIVETAKAHGAQAVYPGTPALHRSAALSRAVSQAKLTFIGGSAETIERVQNKLALRELATLAGARAVPSSERELEDSLDDARALATELGYPVRVKPIAAGTSIAAFAEDASELGAAIQSCKDALAALGLPAKLYLEQQIDRPRALSVPVLVDRFGESIALPERESSVRRGAFILLDESPAPALRGLPQRDTKRQTMFDAASRIAIEAGVIGLANVEFLLDFENHIYVDAITLGLCGGIGATEMSTGRDLAEVQIRMAAQEHLTHNTRDRPIAGHAIEARVRSEATPHNPALGPKPDAIRALRWPPVVPGAMRIEPALSVGVTFAPEDEVLVANVVTYGQTRHQAFLTLDRVLSETTIEPIVSNLRILRDILADESFRAGQYDTGFVERLITQLRAPQVKEAS